MSGLEPGTIVTVDSLGGSRGIIAYNPARSPIHAAAGDVEVFLGSPVGYENRVADGSITSALLYVCPAADVQLIPEEKPKLVMEDGPTTPESIRAMMDQRFIEKFGELPNRRDLDIMLVGMQIVRDELLTMTSNLKRAD